MATPTTYKAIQVKEKGGKLELVQLPMKEPKDNEVLIKVEACGICFGDVHGREGHFPGLRFPLVPGHEIIGRIVKTGSQVPKRLTPGLRIGVGWNSGFCFSCDRCREGDFNMCTDRSVNQITGMHRDGGFAEYMLARHEACAVVPQDADAAELAPLMCAGVTCFNSIRNMDVKAGEVVAVQGIGGLGHLGIQICAKMGFRVVAITSSPSKVALAKSLGAFDAIDTSSQNVIERLSAYGGAKVIVATASGGDMGALAPGLAVDGTLLLLGVPQSVTVNPVVLVSKRAKVQGWSSGHSRDAEECIQFCQEQNIKCHVEKFKLQDVDAGWTKMLNNSVRFRSVLVME